MSTVSVVPLGPEHVASVAAFFARVPEGDRTFFKEPVAGEETVRRWLDAADATGARRLVAVYGDEVVGYVAVIPGIGWSSHVGELRLVVDPSRRGHGLGHRLAHEGLQAALAGGMTKVVVEVVAEQVAAISLFQGLGFVAEALLQDHVRDGTGRLTDLIVLSHHAGDNADSLATIGLDKPL